jgi:flavin-dependent dehydrogenase
VNTDLLVVGSGPTGTSAAIVAAAAGIDVLVVDRIPHVADSARNVAFVSRLFAQGLPLPRLLMRQRIETALLQVGEETLERSWPGYTVPVRNLLRILAGTAMDHGAEIMTGYKLAWITPTGAAQFRGLDHDLDVRAKVVIAADGAHSKTARLMELGHQPFLQLLQCEVLLLRQMNWIELIMDPSLQQGYAWIIPRRTTASIGVALPVQTFGAAPRMLEWLRQNLVLEGVIGPQDINRTSGAMPCGGLRPTLRIGQVILAGDAAGTAHPLALAGIGPAIQSGILAGRAAVRAVHGSGEALRSYQHEMHRWLGPIHGRALERRQSLEQAWNHKDFVELVRDTCL